MKNAPNQRQEYVRDEIEVIRTHESPAGTTVTHTWQGPVSTGAMARYVSAGLSEQRRRQVNVMVGSEWLTFTGTDHSQQAKEMNDRIGEEFQKGGRQFRGVGPVLIPGETSMSQTEAVPCTSLVIGCDGLGSINNQESLDEVVSVLQVAAMTYIEQQMP